DAPAPIPRAILLLMLAYEANRVPHLRMVQTHTFVTKQLQNARGDVGAFGVEHGVVVGKRDFLQDVLGAVLVEGAPAAVFALEGEGPVEAALEACVARFRVAGRNLAERE